MIRYVIAFVAGMNAVLVVALAIELSSGPDEAANAEAVDGALFKRHEDPDLNPPIKVIRVDPAQDADKAGDVHGVMGQRYFEVPPNTIGVSRSELRFVFSRPAEILQIDISVDINDPRLLLVEFAAGINTTEGYGLFRDASWLMHASWSGRNADPGSIDETAVLPAGVEVAAGGFVGIVGFMGGNGSGDPLRVSPEVVVLYRWLDQANSELVG